MISYGNSLVECGVRGFLLYGDSSFTILETLIFDAGTDAFYMGDEYNGILNVERTSVIKSGLYGMSFQYRSWNVEVISSLFADNGNGAFEFNKNRNAQGNLLTLVDTCYDGLVGNGLVNGVEIINSVDTNYTNGGATQCRLHLLFDGPGLACKRARCLFQPLLTYKSLLTRCHQNRLLLNA